MENFGKIYGLKFIMIFRKREVIKLMFVGICSGLKRNGMLFKWLKKCNKMFVVILFLFK